MVFEAISHSGLELVERPAGLCDADDGAFEVAPFQRRLQRRKDLLVGEIAGCAEKHQCVGFRFAHGYLGLSLAAFSKCPPNS